MQTIVSRIATDLGQALKERKAAETAALRFIKAALANVAIDARVPFESLSDDAAIKTLQSLQKKFRDSIDAYKKAGRTELVEQEEMQLKVLLAYVPAPLTREEIQGILQTVIDDEYAGAAPDFGALMKSVLARTAGRADGKLVSELVRARIG